MHPDGVGSGKGWRGAAFLYLRRARPDAKAGLREAKMPQRNAVETAWRGTAWWEYGNPEKHAGSRSGACEAVRLLGAQESGETYREPERRLWCGAAVGGQRRRLEFGGRKMENKTITIYDIAKEAGVSAATVSRVLTNSANVRPEKKERIQYLINKYNFKPNAMARSLTDTRSHVIGIIAADVRNSYYAKVFVACELAARERGYTVLLCNSLGETEQELTQLEMLYEQRVGAIIQLGGRADDLVSDVGYVEMVNQMTNNIPLVVTGKLDGATCYQVQIDAMKAMDLLMEHLVGLGHRQIALVGGRLDVLATFEKVQRYRQILKNYQMDYTEEYIRSGGYDFETGYKRMNELFDCSRMPTAVIAINDYAAAGVMRSAMEHGLRLPEDLSVASYDNTELTELLNPTLTSVDYHYEEFGRKLIDTAIAAADGTASSRIQLITPDLVVRESTAAVKA